MSGNRMPYGTRKSCTHSPMSGKLSTSSIAFPTYMLAITPQKISGCSLMRSGPGCTPWMRNAPTRPGRHESGTDPERVAPQAEAHRRPHRIGPDDAQQHPEKPHAQRLQPRARREVRHPREAEGEEPEELRRPEAQRDRRERRREHHDARHAERSRDE